MYQAKKPGRILFVRAFFCFTKTNARHIQSGVAKKNELQVRMTAGDEMHLL
jgi:hypothetical protein